jgi:hypothetical protein
MGDVDGGVRSMMPGGGRISRVIIHGKTFTLGRGIDDEGWLLQGLQDSRLRRLAVATWLRVPAVSRAALRKRPLVLIECPHPFERTDPAGQVWITWGSFQLTFDDFDEMVGCIKLATPVMEDGRVIYGIAHELRHSYQSPGWRLQTKRARRHLQAAEAAGDAPVAVSHEVATSWETGMEDAVDRELVTVWPFAREVLAEYQGAGRRLPEWLKEHLIPKERDHGHS